MQYKQMFVLIFITMILKISNLILVRTFNCSHTSVISVLQPISVYYAG